MVGGERSRRTGRRLGPGARVLGLLPAACCLIAGAAGAWVATGDAPLAGAQTAANAVGAVQAFGDAAFHGSMGGAPLNGSVVGMASAPDGGGYWEVASDGGVFGFGTAAFHGSMGGTPLNAPVVGIAAPSGGRGYWEVASDGGIFSFGTAAFHGSMGGTPLNAAIVGMAADPATGGYWEVASDGGVFAFDAPFLGSMGGTSLNAPIVGMTAMPTGNGYWLVASDGGIFAFGSAPYNGSMGGRTLNAPVVDMAATPDGGYWEVAADGGIFTFGGAAYHGSMGGTALAAPVVGMAATPDGGGYWEVQGSAASGSAVCSNPNFVTGTPSGGTAFGSYYVSNNMWNPISVSQTLYACNYNSWYVDATMTSQGGAVQTYPNSQLTFGSPPPLGTLGSLSSSFADSTTPSGSGDDYEYAYDIWINGYGGAGTSELMIWNYDNGQAPAGKPVGSFTDGGRTYDVYVSGTPSTGDYIAFVATSNFTAGTLNLVDFFDRAITAGWVSGGAAAALWQVDYGVEICSTGGQMARFAVTDFNVAPTYI